MMQAAEPWRGLDGGRRERWALDQPSCRGVLIQGVMASIIVVVVNILPKQAPQMFLVEDNDVVEDISPATADPAFCHAILPRATVRYSNRFHAKGNDCIIHARVENLVPIMNQIPANGFLWKRLAKLLHHPARGWVFGDIRVQDFSSPVRYENESVKQTETNR